MDGIIGFGVEVGAAAAAGLLVLLVEKWLGRRAQHRGARSGAPGTSSGSVTMVQQHGSGSHAVVQQGSGHRAVFDHSTHTTTHNTYGDSGGSRAKSDGDDALLVLFGGFVAMAVLVAGFFLTEHYLRILFAALIGGVIGAGLAVVRSGVRSRKAASWHMLAALPWLIASVSGVWLWGRWLRLWGEPLPRLDELGQAVAAVPVGRTQGWVAQALDVISGVSGIVFDPAQASMPGVLSIMCILVHVIALFIAATVLWSTSASALVSRIAAPSPGLVRRAASFDDTPWRTGGGAALGVVLVCGVGWVITSGWFLQVTPF